MRSPEGPLAHYRRARRQDASDRINPGHFQRFVSREWRQDTRQSARQQGLARTGRPGHENVVAASRGELEGALGVLLPMDICEIDQVLVRPLVCHWWWHRRFERDVAA